MGTDRLFRTSDHSDLRQKARHLTDLATRLESVSAMRLQGRCTAFGSGDDRAELCERMLEANLQQLHAAAEDLRLVAYRLTTRAGGSAT